MEVKGIRLEIGYHGQIVIPSFDITVNKGEITTIIGPNGSGKSTLLKAITRLLPCSSGIVSLDGKDIRKLPLLAADTLGRTLINGMEIPVGIVMAATGGPFFLYMLRKKGNVRGS